MAGPVRLHGLRTLVACHVLVLVTRAHNPTISRPFGQISSTFARAGGLPNSPVPIGSGSSLKDGNLGGSDDPYAAEREPFWRKIFGLIRRSVLVRADMSPQMAREPEKARRPRPKLAERPTNQKSVESLRSIAAIMGVMWGLDTIGRLARGFGGGGGGGVFGPGGFGGGGGGGGGGQNFMPPHQDRNRPEDCRLKSVELFKFKHMHAFSYCKFKYQAGSPDKFGVIQGIKVDRIRLKWKEAEFLEGITVTSTDKATLWINFRTSMGRESMVNFTTNATAPLEALHKMKYLHTDTYRAKKGYEIVGLCVEDTSVCPLVKGIYQRQFKVSKNQYEQKDTYFGGSRYSVSNPDAIEPPGTGASREQLFPNRREPETRKEWEINNMPMNPKTAYMSQSSTRYND